MSEVKPREITAGELRGLLSGLEDNAEVRILTQDIDRVAPKPNRYTGKDHKALYLMFTANPNHPQDTAGMIDRRTRNGVEQEYRICLHAREAWDGDLKPSECHVTSEEELSKLRSAEG